LSRSEELLRDGDIEACLGEVTEAVRSCGDDIEQRVLLFQLFCITGDWERARRQLYILKDMAASTIPMFETYDPVLQCEIFRLAVFAGQRSPVFFGEPQEWLATLASSLAPIAEGRIAEAERLLDKAFDGAPELIGRLNGSAFEWIGDADGRLGPVLEVFLNGRYYWVPFDKIARIRVDEPEDLRDLVWSPAEFQWTNGGQAVGFIPSRYPGTEIASDNRLRLSRMTDWEQLSDGLLIGSGQRILVTDQDECPLLGVREIVLGGALDDEVENQGY